MLQGPSTSLSTVETNIDPCQTGMSDIQAVCSTSAQAEKLGTTLPFGRRAVQLSRSSPSSQAGPWGGSSPCATGSRAGRNYECSMNGTLRRGCDCKPDRSCQARLSLSATSDCLLSLVASNLCSSAVMFASLFVILGALLPSAMALTSEDVASIFGTTQPLTGSMVALPQFTFSVITNDCGLGHFLSVSVVAADSQPPAHALVTLNATEKKPEEVGWMATGVGTVSDRFLFSLGTLLTFVQSMTNADMLVAWMAPTPSPIAPWVLSHREATGPTMPKVSSTAPDTMTTSFYTFLPQLSTSDPTSPYTSVSYLRPLIMPPNYPSLSSFKNLMKVKTGFIYASSSHRPASDAPDGPIGKHDEVSSSSQTPKRRHAHSTDLQEHATVTLDLSTHIDLNHELPESEAADHHGMQSWTSEAWPLPREASEGGPLTRRDIVLAIHGTSSRVLLLKDTCRGSCCSKTPTDLTTPSQLHSAPSHSSSSPHSPSSSLATAASSTSLGSAFTLPSKSAPTLSSPSPSVSPSRPFKIHTSATPTRSLVSSSSSVSRVNSRSGGSRIRLQ